MTDKSVYMVRGGLVRPGEVHGEADECSHSCTFDGSKATTTAKNIRRPSVAVRQRLDSFHCKSPREGAHKLSGQVPSV